MIEKTKPEFTPNHAKSQRTSKFDRLKSGIKCKLVYVVLNRLAWRFVIRLSGLGLNKKVFLH